jgi:hypothetical protein
VRVGLVPLVVLAALAGGTLLGSALARALTASGGFFAQRQATLVVLVVGGVLAAIGYAATVLWAWHRQRRWNEAGAYAAGSGTLASLTLTALVVLLPIVLAFVVPQHPAP